jgi:hypothetical protein
VHAVYFVLGAWTGATIMALVFVLLLARRKEDR